MENNEIKAREDKARKQLDKQARLYTEEVTGADLYSKQSGWLYDCARWDHSGWGAVRYDA